eukprot:g16464.t1
MGALMAKLRELFFQKKLEIALVGLENSGKTTFCNQLAMGKFVQEPPTVGLNVKSCSKGNVNIKVWDIGGQKQYRSEWGRYTKGCNCIVFVVDTQEPSLVPVERKELHQLLDDRELKGIPVLVVANKIDLGPKIGEKELIRGLNLDYITENPWLVVPCSAKFGTNMDQALQFLIKQAE